uniref:RING-type domain-containing protein n=1 Tax=Gopherus agassizii TaxID=38772 RepID=A0A452H3H3_9SAUR
YPIRGASCPICGEYFKDPVVIDCGHSFCRACISQCWEGLDTSFFCPQCRETADQRNLRPNRPLANVLELAKPSLAGIRQQVPQSLSSSLSCHRRGREGGKDAPSKCCRRMERHD